MARLRRYRSKPLPEAVKVEIRRLLLAGMRWRDICDEVDVSQQTIAVVLRQAGGMPSRRIGRSPGQLSLVEREEISRGLIAGDSYAAIARRLGRSTSTVSREVKENEGRQRYRAWAADRRADDRACRPKPTKLSQSPGLVAYVENGLELHWSPEQISSRIIDEFPDDPEMRVSPETIYQELFVQGRGSLRKELAKCLRSGRARRRPRTRRNGGEGKIIDKVMISERPAEVEDRAVPGHWEGDLIVGKDGRSAIGTLVERSTRFVMLLHLDGDHSAETVRDAMAAKILTLHEALRRSITWDQGTEMAQHAQFTIDTGVQIYFCDPHAPWQRGSNENTNGLLRQYFPKGTDLSIYTEAELDAVADQLNGRPRKTLNWKTPSETLNQTLVALAA
jgi:transposase, IS30 family